MIKVFYLMRLVLTGWCLLLQLRDDWPNLTLTGQRNMGLVLYGHKLNEPALLIAELPPYTDMADALRLLNNAPITDLDNTGMNILPEQIEKK